MHEQRATRGRNAPGTAHGLTRIVMQSIDDNPIAARQARRDSRPSPLKTLLLAAGVALLMFPLSLTVFVPELRFFNEALHAMVYVLAGAFPLMIAVLAAMLTAGEVQDVTFDLLLLTRISSGRLVAGYFLGAVYRLRVPLALLAGLLTLPALTALWSVLFFSGVKLTPIDLVGVLLWWLCPLAFAVGVWNLNLAAAALGVRLAFRYRDRSLPIALAALYMAGLQALAMLLMLPLLWIVLATTPWLFGGFAIAMFLLLPLRMRASQIGGATDYVHLHVLNLPSYYIPEAPFSLAPHSPERRRWSSRNRLTW